MSLLQAVDFSVLELATISDQETSPSGALKRALLTAKHVEQLGFKRFWVAEHHNMEAIASSATTVLMGYLAANTERIRIGSGRSEEHTSELQSRPHLVCRLLLEKKKKNKY